MSVNWIIFLSRMTVGLAVLSLVRALTIDNQLMSIQNDCYERLAIGERLDPRDVYKSLPINTVSDCQMACTQEDIKCLSFSIGIGTKGNGTCELTISAIKETADLKPIGTVKDQDYDLYIKKLGCKLNLQNAFPTSNPQRPSYDTPKPPGNGYHVVDTNSDFHHSSYNRPGDGRPHHGGSSGGYGRPTDYFPRPSNHYENSRPKPVYGPPPAPPRPIYGPPAPPSGGGYDRPTPDRPPLPLSGGYGDRPGGGYDRPDRPIDRPDRPPLDRPDRPYGGRPHPGYSGIKPFEEERDQFHIHGPLLVVRPNLDNVLPVYGSKPTERPYYGYGDGYRRPEDNRFYGNGGRPYERPFLGYGDDRRYPVDMGYEYGRPHYGAGGGGYGSGGYDRPSNSVRPFDHGGYDYSRPVSNSIGGYGGGGSNNAPPDDHRYNQIPLIPAHETTGYSKGQDNRDKDRPDPSYTPTSTPSNGGSSYGGNVSGGPEPRPPQGTSNGDKGTSSEEDPNPRPSPPGGYGNGPAPSDGYGSRPDPRPPLVGDRFDQGGGYNGGPGGPTPPQSGNKGTSPPPEGGSDKDKQNKPPPDGGYSSDRPPLPSTLPPKDGYSSDRPCSSASGGCSDRDSTTPLLPPGGGYDRDRPLPNLPPPKGGYGIGGPCSSRGGCDRDRDRDRDRNRPPLPPLPPPGGYDGGRDRFPPPPIGGYDRNRPCASGGCDRDRGRPPLPPIEGYDRDRPVSAYDRDRDRLPLPPRGGYDRDRPCASGGCDRNRDRNRDRDRPDSYDRDRGRLPLPPLGGYGDRDRDRDRPSGGGYDRDGYRDKESNRLPGPPSSDFDRNRPSLGTGGYDRDRDRPSILPLSGGYDRPGGGGSYVGGNSISVSVDDSKDPHIKPNSIVSHNPGPNGGIFTSIITELPQESSCFRRALAGKRVSRTFVKRSLPCERVDDCEEECAREKRFDCEGFNYRIDPRGRGRGECELVAVPLSHLDLGRDLYPDRDYDFFERDRNTCRGRPEGGDFYRPPGYYGGSGGGGGGYRPRPRPSYGEEYPPNRDGPSRPPVGGDGDRDTDRDQGGYGGAGGYPPRGDNRRPPPGGPGGYGDDGDRDRDKDRPDAYPPNRGDDRRPGGYGEEDRRPLPPRGDGRRPGGYGEDDRRPPPPRGDDRAPQGYGGDDRRPPPYLPLPPREEDRGPGGYPGRPDERPGAPCGGRCGGGPDDRDRDRRPPPPLPPPGYDDRGPPLPPRGGDDRDRRPPPPRGDERRPLPPLDGDDRRPGPCCGDDRGPPPDRRPLPPPREDDRRPLPPREDDRRPLPPRDDGRRPLPPPPPGPCCGGGDRGPPPRGDDRKPLPPPRGDDRDPGGYGGGPPDGDRRPVPPRGNGYEGEAPQPPRGNDRDPPPGGNEIAPGGNRRGDYFSFHGYNSEERPGGYYYHRRRPYPNRDDRPPYDHKSFEPYLPNYDQGYRLPYPGDMDKYIRDRERDRNYWGLSSRDRDRDWGSYGGSYGNFGRPELTYYGYTSGSGYRNRFDLDRPSTSERPKNWGVYGGSYGYGGGGSSYDYWGLDKKGPQNNYSGVGFPEAPRPIVIAIDRPPSRQPPPGSYDSDSPDRRPPTAVITYVPPRDDCSIRSGTGFRLHKAVVKKLFSVSTIYECEILCSKEPTFKCMAYSYRYPIRPGGPLENCYLTDRPYKELDFYTDLEPDRDYDVYDLNNANMCIEPERRPFEYSECFLRVRSGIRLDHRVVRDSLNCNSIVDCQLECLRTTRFTCRSFSYRFGPPVIGGSIDNCQLTDWPFRDLDPVDQMVPEPGYELYERGSFGHGCEPNHFQIGLRPKPQPIGVVKGSNELCYVGYGSPARLLPAAIRKELVVKSEIDCKVECTKARIFTLLQCMTFSFRPLTRKGEPNCELSDIKQWDLLPDIDYIRDPGSWLFAWDNYNLECLSLSDIPSSGGLNKDFGFGDRDDRYPLINPLDTWSRFTVSGWPCRRGTECRQNREVGFWSCEIEGGDAGAWDYCCRPDHQCGYSEGFRYQWCYVGDDRTQWRKCSDKYFPYGSSPAASNWVDHYAVPNRKPSYGYRPNRPSNTYIPSKYPPFRPERPALIEDRPNRPRPGSENHDHHFNNQFLDPPRPGGFGHGKHWPVSYLHRELPPNMTANELPPNKYDRHRDQQFISGSRPTKENYYSSRKPDKGQTHQQYTAIENLIDIIKSNDLKNVEYQIANHSNEKDDVLFVKIPLPTGFTSTGDGESTTTTTTTTRRPGIFILDRNRKDREGLESQDAPVIRGISNTSSISHVITLNDGGTVSRDKMIRIHLSDKVTALPVGEGMEGKETVKPTRSTGTGIGSFRRSSIFKTNRTSNIRTARRRAQNPVGVVEVTNPRDIK